MPWQVSGGQRTPCSRSQLLPAMVVVVVEVWESWWIGQAACISLPIEAPHQPPMLHLLSSVLF